MIGRMWHGRVSKEKAAAYHAFLKISGMADYRATEGNVAAHLFKKEEGDITHFYTLTFWKDLESIKKFAGIDYEKARYYPEDNDFLLEKEEYVSHFDILE